MVGCFVKTNGMPTEPCDSTSVLEDEPGKLDIIIHSSSILFIQGFNELEKLLKKHDVCIAETEKLLKDSGVPNKEFYDRIVDRLNNSRNARGKYFVSTPK